MAANDSAIPRSPASAAVSTLTPRQLECLRLVFDGFEIKDIARRLTISPRVVEEHLSKARAKLGVVRSNAAARVAAEALGWARVEPRGGPTEGDPSDYKQDGWRADREPDAIQGVRDSAVATPFISAGDTEGENRGSPASPFSTTIKLLSIVLLIIVIMYGATKLPDVFARIASVVRPRQ